MSGLNVSYNQALTRGQLIRSLQGQNRGLDSRNALIQASNDISLLGVQQNAALEGLMQQQLSFQAEHYALEQAKEEEALARHILDSDSARIGRDAIHNRRLEAERKGSQNWRIGR